ncbi:GNAT family N-acetyltransferase [Wenxinia saemankumensis]|uniref:Acetyltransferase, GNAT family n=1 Tax=Wenxinia saemankumensis TaxID=1447782 RepID=A0A1M6CLQ6_9RHOB|nr:N-acetyltransferase [Wenxinia saemankumensis]SHI61947.1 Acetyltransferase, GNAT family [Wenxinia saemankumensis]
MQDRPFTIRPLTAADAVAFRHVRLEALARHPEAYGSTLSDWSGRPNGAFVARLEQGTVFGLWTGRGLEGTLAYAREAGGNTRHRATITTLYLRERLRGQGGAEALMEAAIARARADGVAQLELTVAEGNAVARRFYARSGFEEVARLPRALRVAGRDMDEILLILRLDEPGSAPLSGPVPS